MADAEGAVFADDHRSGSVISSPPPPGDDVKATAKFGSPRVEAMAVETVLCSGCMRKCVKRLKCPVCFKQQLQPQSYFCDQACFQANWADHVLVHNIPQPTEEGEGQAVVTWGEESLANGVDVANPKTYVKDGRLKPFSKFKFSGPLRPWPTPEKRTVPDSIPKPGYALRADGRDLMEEKSKRFKPFVNDAEEIVRLRRSCLLAREALDLAHRLAVPGATTESIDKAVHDFVVSRGAYPSPLNYYKFPKSLCTSVNEVICHGIPDLRPLEFGDMLNVDVTVYFEGMHGDLNETWLIGLKSDLSNVKEFKESDRKLIAATYNSTFRAIDYCKPGAHWKQIGDIITNVCEVENNFKVNKSYCGHGVGRLFHTNPNVKHYKNNGMNGTMEPGCSFTIEPMVCKGSGKDIHWPDDWTAVTSDGNRTAQFEHTLIVTETGVDILTARLPSSLPLGIEDLFDATSKRLTPF